MPISLVVSAQPTSPAPSRWQGTLLAGLLVYVVAVGTWMLTGFGGAATQHYLGLLADGPACLAAVVMAGMTSRRLTRGALRTAWSCVTAALALYFAGTVIAAVSWLFDRDPFPGPADVFFLAFYPAFFAAVLFFVRARAMRVPWARLALDVVILAVGFGASFWFLAIRPVTLQAELDFLKQLLSQVYLALNSAVLLSLGLLLLTGPDGAGGRRVPLLLLLGCTTMTLADIVWAMAKVGGGYLPGGLQDVMYVAWYLPIGVAAREQLRRPAPAVVPAVDSPPSLVHGAAVRRGPDRVPGARLRGARRGRRTGGGHDARRLRAHAARDGPPGHHAPRRCEDPRAAGHRNGGGPLRLAHRERVRRHPHRRGRRRAAVRLARLRADVRTEAGGRVGAQPLRLVERRRRRSAEGVHRASSPRRLRARSVRSSCASSAPRAAIRWRSSAAT